jgi:hypothetical protein
LAAYVKRIEQKMADQISLAPILAFGVDRVETTSGFPMATAAVLRCQEWVRLKKGL